MTSLLCSAANACSAARVAGKEGEEVGAVGDNVANVAEESKVGGARGDVEGVVAFGRFEV